MIKKHLKSVCRCEHFIRHGGKRRKCVSCGRTWTIRPRRRGRKQFRAEHNLIERYLSGSIHSIRTLAKQNCWNRDHAQQMVRRSLARYVAKHGNNLRPSLPSRGRLVAVADAIWHRIRREKITIYLILLRPVGSDEATIALPVFFPGHEDREGWRYAWKQIPAAYLRRISALVCDGQWWLISFGYRQGWVVQRCQFHLLANLQMYLGIRDRQRNSKVLALVHDLFTTADPKRSRLILAQLAKIRAVSKSRGMRRVLSGLETNYQDFQSYLRHPRLNLPTTTNTAESCISGVRELMRRCRGFRSKEALLLWVTGYILWKKTIRCNGKKPQKKPV